MLSLSLSLSVCVTHAHTHARRSHYYSMQKSIARICILVIPDSTTCVFPYLLAAPVSFYPWILILFFSLDSLYGCSTRSWPIKHLNKTVWRFTSLVGFCTFKVITWDLYIVNFTNQWIISHIMMMDITSRTMIRCESRERHTHTHTHTHAKWWW